MNEIRRPAAALPSRTEYPAETDGTYIVWDGVFGFLKRRRRTIAKTTFVVLALGLAALLLVPWNYKATAVVALNSFPAIPENPEIHTPIPLAERIQREIGGLQSREIAAKVIDKLRLDQNAEFDPADGLLPTISAWIGALTKPFRGGAGPQPAEAAELRRSAVVDIFMNKLSVAPVLTSEVIQVTFSSRDPRTAYSAANGVVDAYIEAATARRASALQQAADGLQERITAVRKELRDLPASAESMNTIERQLDAKRTLLQAYIAKLGDLLLLKAAIEPRVFVQSRAVYPMERAGVPLVFGVPAVTIIGLLAGIGFSLVQESRQKAVTSPSELETILGLRLIGVGENGAAPAERVLGADPKRLARACDRIALELLMARGANRPVVVAFAAPSPSEAKSAICVGVAQALGRAGHRALIVDANLSRSTAQAKLAGQAAGETHVPASAATPDGTVATLPVRRLASGGVDVLLTGLDRESRAAEYEKAIDAVARLAPSYEFTMLDLPPMGEAPEARYVARCADIAILVARHNHDYRHAIRAVSDQLRANGTQIAGTVLTRGSFERGVFSWAADRLGLRT